MATESCAASNDLPVPPSPESSVAVLAGIKPLACHSRGGTDWPAKLAAVTGVIREPPASSTLRRCRHSAICWLGEKSTGKSKAALRTSSAMTIVRRRM